jgi:hypothetical protein
MDNHEARNELPKHMPVEMAVAPDRKPYEHTHIIHTSSSGQNDHNKLAQHSLSPEKLGVVGYVKDVAGFVKDVVDDRREKKALVASRRRNSSSASSSESNARTTSSNQTIDVPVADIPDEKQRRRSSAEHHHHNTAFADAVTSLFPGVSSIGDVNEHGGCTHADELRSQMMHVNDQQETSMMNGGGRKLL